ncbi:MAG: glutathione S-transferase N-terminal domain-containing protein [Rhizobiales bacterium]|nr:glutathione S-transferase N-terminal domain-containing protein [Hyphomicrobiales bacterium]
MILVGQYDSPFVRRVAVTLHHYHMPFTRDTKSVFGDAKAMQKINPLIRVPSLILEGGETLVDSAAIIDCLDEMAGPARALTPAHGPERRKVLQAVAIATGAMDKAVQIFLERHFHPGKMLSREWESRCLKQLAGALDHLERGCGAPWFIDSQMSQADVTIGCLIGYLKLRVADAFPANRYPRIHSLAVHCELREEFVKSRPGANETMPAAKGRS